MAFGALETLISDQDAAYVDDPCTVRRTIFVPAESVGTLDFDITAQERDALYNRGLQVAERRPRHHERGDGRVDDGLGQQARPLTGVDAAEGEQASPLSWPG